MGKVFSAGLAAIVVASFAVALTTQPGPNPGPMPMTVWEAYSRGLLTITQVNLTVSIGGQPATAPLGYEVRNRAAVDVLFDEYALLLSPNPAQPSPGPTTQDGLLTKLTVPAASTVTYGFGDFVAEGLLTNPPWWCTEERQAVRSRVVIALGGEVAPFAIESIAQSLNPGDAGTQRTLWDHLKANPTVVVGKTVDGSFWKNIPAAGQSLQIALRATNLAIKDSTDAVMPDPDAPKARVWDVIPAGFTLDASSVTPGYTVTTNPDGSTTLAWIANLPSADVTGRPQGPAPTPYASKTFLYRVTTPTFAAGRVALPRAHISVTDDATAEAHSAQPVLDALAANRPPVADAGPSYAGTEGETISLTAAATIDPDGDPLQYRWDFDADGTWDTSWSTNPSASARFGDDFTGNVRVEASDGEFADSAEAPVRVRNAPSAVSVVARPRPIGELPFARFAPLDPIAFEGTAEDPGSDDLAFTWDFGDGSGSTGGRYFNDGVGPDPNPSPGGRYPFATSEIVWHAFTQPGAYVVTLTVKDDDGGVTRATRTILVVTAADLKHEAIQRIKALKELALARGDDEFVESLDDAEEQVWKSLGFQHPFHPEGISAELGADVGFSMKGHDKAELFLGPSWVLKLPRYAAVRMTWTNGVVTVIDLPDGWPDAPLHARIRVWVDAWRQDIRVDAETVESDLVLKAEAHDVSSGFTLSLDTDEVATFAFEYGMVPFWIDDLHLNPEEGEEVFEHEEEAVEQLLHEEEEDHPRGEPGSGEDEEPLPRCRLELSLWTAVELEALEQECDLIANLLVQADEVLAKVALKEAKEIAPEGAGGSKGVLEEIGEAERELARAYSEWRDQRYEDAIEHFEEAWEHAQHALEHASEG